MLAAEQERHRKGADAALDAARLQGTDARKAQIRAEQDEMQREYVLQQRKFEELSGAPAIDPAERAAEDEQEQQQQRQTGAGDNDDDDGGVMRDLDRRRGGGNPQASATRGASQAEAEAEEEADAADAASTQQQQPRQTLQVPASLFGGGDTNVITGVRRRDATPAQLERENQEREHRRHQATPFASANPIPFAPGGADNLGQSASAPGASAHMAGGGGDSAPSAKFQVGGASLTDWRARISRLRARGEGNLVVRLQGEIGYAHVLSQTGQLKDAEECLKVGEYVWVKLAELRHASPESAGSTHGVVLNVCSAMKRAARTVGVADVQATWESRLEESQSNMKASMEFSNPKQMRPQDMEPNKAGVRKHRVEGNAMWAQLRNPLMNVGWAKKHVSPDPDVGPRYTGDRTKHS